MHCLLFSTFWAVLCVSRGQQIFPNFNFRGNQPQQQQNQFGFPSFYNPNNFYFPGQQQQTPNNQQNLNYPGQNSNQQQYQRPPQQQQQRPQNRPQNPPINLTTRRPSQNPQNNLRERISERKCRDYAAILKVHQAITSLSLDAATQSIAVDKCDTTIGLVVGGVDAKRGEFPHMAALGFPDGLDGTVSFKCGGTLISDKFVLSAAHCSKADRVSPTVVRLGDLNLKLKENGLPETDIPILRFISHEKYDKRSSHNDIALVELDRSLSQQFQKFLRPACLATSNRDLKTKVIASGWGFTEVGGRTSDILQKVELNIIDNNVCRSIYNDQENYDIDDTQLCAGELLGGKDTCQGDSGGPLQVISDKKCVFTIIGVTSYGPTFCGTANQPGIYTKVSAYIDWIERKVWPNQ